MPWEKRGGIDQLVSEVSAACECLHGQWKAKWRANIPAEGKEGWCRKDQVKQYRRPQHTGAWPAPWYWWYTHCLYNSVVNGFPLLSCASSSHSNLVVPRTGRGEMYLSGRVLRNWNKRKNCLSVETQRLREALSWPTAKASRPAFLSSPPLPQTKV